MKTPRDLLLSEHRAMELALDRQRHQFVAELTSPAPANLTPGQWLATAWRELFVASRRAWLGLSAVWLIIGGLQLVQDEPPAVAHRPLLLLPPPGMLDGIDYLYAFGHRTSGSWPGVPRQRINHPPAEPKPPGPRGDSPLNNFGFWRVPNPGPLNRNLRDPMNFKQAKV